MSNFISPSIPVTLFDYYTDVHGPKDDNYTKMSYPLRTGQSGIRIATGTKISLSPSNRPNRLRCPPILFSIDIGVLHPE